MKMFNQVCLHLLLDHHGEGIIQAAPNYITEKLQWFEDATEEEAWAKLDHPNHLRLVEWCEKWGVKLDPKYYEAIAGEIQAAYELKRMGFDL